MKKTTLSICLAGMMLVPAAAIAQATVDLRINLPLVLPRLVVVSPGIEVVPDVDYEVFHVDGWYWVRQDDGWYRSRSHRGGWVAVPPRSVPPGLVRIPPGQYRKWRPAAAPARRGGDEGWERRRHDDDGGWRGRERGDGGWKGRGEGGKKHGKHGGRDDD